MSVSLSKPSASMCTTFGRNSSLPGATSTVAVTPSTAAMAA